MKKPVLSKRAQRLLDHIRNGAWYTALGKKVPAAMAELESAGLVVPMGRVARIVVCYVPKGTKPLRIEQYPTQKAKRTKSK